MCERIWNVQFDTLARLQFDVGKEDVSYLESSGLCGICNKHLRMFNRITTSSISSKLLQYLIEISLNGNVFRVCGKPCPVCERLEAVEREEICRIAGIPFEQTSGDFVCMDHLKKIINATHPENKEKILKAYRDSLRKLLAQLKVLETENYYQVSAEVRSSLWRTVEKLSGRR